MGKDKNQPFPNEFPFPMKDAPDRKGAMLCAPLVNQYVSRIFLADTNLVFPRKRGVEFTSWAHNRCPASAVVCLRTEVLRQTGVSDSPRHRQVAGRATRLRLEW